MRVPGPSTSPGEGPRGRTGFSLIEVVLAIGIISFSLVAILGLFGTSLRSNSDTISQHEVMGISRSVADFLGSGSSVAGFSNVYRWVQSTNSDPGIYAFVQSNGQITNGLGDDEAFVSATTSRSGRLFRMQISLSPNMPLRRVDGSVVGRPVASDLPATPELLTNDASLAIQIRMFSVPAPGIPVTNLQPLFTYDTMVKK